MVKKLPRPAEVILPILREALGDDVTATSWIPDVDHRKYPLVQIRRFGGNRPDRRPGLVVNTGIELSAYSADGIVEA